MLSLASMNRMNRSIQEAIAYARSIANDTQITRKQNEELLSLVRDQNAKNKKMNSYLMAKVPDMNDYFPLRDSATLDRFLDEWDGLYPLRRSEFYNLLLTCASDKKNLFGTSILNTFFSSEYISSHTWPTNR